MYIQYLWQGNHQIYGHIRCIYTVLASLISTVPCPFQLPFNHTHASTHATIDSACFIPAALTLPAPFHSPFNHTHASTHTTTDSASFIPAALTIPAPFQLPFNHTHASTQITTDSASFNYLLLSRSLPLLITLQPHPCVHTHNY